MKNIVIIIWAIFFVACSNQNSFDKEKYMKEGKEIAQATGKTLAGHVKKAIQEKGPFEAIEFCSLSAYPLTDSLSNLYQVKISRKAVKYRNPDNKANEKESKIIEGYVQQIETGKKVKPQVLKEDGKIVFYAPIQLQHACLVCHGEPQKEIPDTLYRHIKKLYPEDIAVDFKEGDLRGVWRLEFE